MTIKSPPSAIEGHAPTAPLESPSLAASPAGRRHLRRELVGTLAPVILVSAAVATVLQTGGSRAEVIVSMPEGSPGGMPYAFHPLTGALILALAAMPLVGILLARRAARAETLRSDFAASVADGLAALIVFRPAWSWLVLGWFVATDLTALLPSQLVAPLGRVVQILTVDAIHGRLWSAAATTVIRNALALTIAGSAALLFVAVLGEFKELVPKLLPWLRSAALIPPLVLFAYAPWLGRLLGARPVRESIERADFAGAPNLALIIGMPDRLLILASIAFWPLLIVGLDRYSRVSSNVAGEIMLLRVPRWPAITSVKLPAVLHSLAPAAHIAIVLVFVSCYWVEVGAAPAEPRAGLARLYLYPGSETYGTMDLLAVSLVTLLGAGLSLLAMTDIAAAYVTGERHSRVH